MDSSVAARRTLRQLSLLLLCTLLASWLPQPRRALPSLLGPAPAAAATLPQIVPAATGPAGRLNFSADIDLDGDDVTNPSATTPVPVVRYAVTRELESILHTRIALAVEVTPNATTQNPANTLVTFEVWNPQTGVRWTRTAAADAWGAAQAMIDIAEDQMAGRFSYHASAPGYGTTTTRTFSISPTTYAYDMHLGDVKLQTTTAPNGQLQVDLESQAVIGTSELATQLMLVALIPAPIRPHRPAGRCPMWSPSVLMTIMRGPVSSSIRATMW